MRLPTQDEVNAALCEQEAEERRRAAEFRARRDAPLRREQTEAAQELRADGVVLTEPIRLEPPAAWTTAEVDVLREPLPARADAPPAPTAPPKHYYCGNCGKVFSLAQYKTAGLAMSARTKHVKKTHPEGSAI